MRVPSDRKDRELRTVQKLLHHHAPTLSRMIEGFLAIGGDNHSLASSQTVIFDDVRRAKLIKSRLHFGRARAHRRPGRRHASRRHHVLSERLRSLKLGGFGTRSVDRNPLGAHLVSNPRNKRRLRSDDHQISFDVLGQLRHRLPIHRVNIVQLGH